MALLRKITLLFLLLSFVVRAEASSIQSFETPYTISYVREANFDGVPHIIASGYDGEVVCLDYEGNIKWISELNGYFNHDLCCYDIDDDGKDEVMCASGDGTLYVLDDNGSKLWNFRANEIPLYSVTALKSGDQTVIACGGFDKNIYFLTPSNNLLHTVESTEYSTVTGWGNVGSKPQCSINFLRRIKDAEGKDLLAVHGTVSSHFTGGGLYIMDVDIAGKKFKVLRSVPENNSTAGLAPVPIGYFARNRALGGADKVILGITAAGNQIGFEEIDYVANTQRHFYFNEQDWAVYSKKFQSFGYRITHIEAVKGLQENYDYNYIMFTGNTITILRPDLTWDAQGDDFIWGKYSYNDMYVDHDNMKMVLASCQSGGNCVHVVDLKGDRWSKDFEEFVPIGNISKILKGSGDLRSGVERFVQPSWEVGRPVVSLMSESATDPYAQEYINKYPALNFLATSYDVHIQDPESWNRNEMSSVQYRSTRHGGRIYDLDAEESVNAILDNYPGMPGYTQVAGANYLDNCGASYWAGHGSDPFFYSPATWNKVIEETKGRESVVVFYELRTDASAEIDYLMDTLFVPLAQKSNNGYDFKMNIHNHGIFWMANVNSKDWYPITSGEFPNAFIPAMEETSARTQAISLSGRVGLWASHSVNNWGTAASRDNAAYDRQRQNSHQMLPNHALRHMIFHLSLGATYTNSYPVDQEYTSILWDMIGKGLIYVPKREELISISPVNLAVDEPDEELLEKAENHKWTISLDPETVGSRDAFVIDKHSSAWVASPLNKWDYSKYAACIDDRRQNFLPPFPYGLVLFTPGEESNKYRAHISQQLHPLYRNIMKTYHTDGRDYIVDGARMGADTYYKTVEEDIKELSKKLPLTVGGGEVAWVAAHSGPKHIRLTILDGGYINQDDAIAHVTFNTVIPTSIIDLVTGEKFFVNGENEVEIEVPTGMVRFLDVELEEDL